MFSFHSDGDTSPTVLACDKVNITLNSLVCLTECVAKKLKLVGSGGWVCRVGYTLTEPFVVFHRLTMPVTLSMHPPELMSKTI